MQIFAILWERCGRPRFWIHFAESPLSGINDRGEHISAEDVLPGNLGLLRGWLIPGTGSTWFCLDDQPLWRRLILRKRSDPDQVVDLLLKLFPEVIEWWEKKVKGNHLKVFPAISLPPKATHQNEQARMFSFRYTTAEYQCTKCPNGRSEHGSNISLPYLIIALLATIAWSFRLFSVPLSFPWYYFFSAFAGELLLLFVAGFPLTLFKIATGGGSITRRCPKCGGQMTFRGRHFTYSQTPYWEDCALFIIFVVLNVVAWINLF